MNFDHDLGLIDSILTIDTTVAPPLGGLTGSLSITGTGALIVPTGTNAQRPGSPTAAMIRFNTDSSVLEFHNGTTWSTLSSGGTVTSVALSAPSIFTVSGSPVTGAGTLSFSLNTQTQNIVFASPNGSTGAPTFRALVAADIPSLSYLPLAGGSMTSGANVTFSGGGTVTGLPTPTNASDAAPKSYVDSVAAGLDPKESVKAATTGPLAGITYNATGGAGGTGQITSAPTTVDGVATTAAGTRVLVKNQADAKQNGIYVVVSSGTWDRASDQDGSPASEVSGGNFTFVENGGTANANTGWVISGTGIQTLNTDNINWVQYSGSGTYTATSPVALTGSAFSLSGLSGFGSANQVIGVNNAAGALEYKTITAGTAISVAHAAGAITINNTGVTAFAITTAAQSTGLALSGATGSITLTLDNDLEAIAALTTTGIIARTAAGSMATRTIAGTANQIAVTNGTGVSGDPTIAIANNVVLPGTASMTVVSGSTANQPAAGVGQLRYDTTTNQLMWSNAGSWNVLSTGGTVTSVAVSGGTTGLTTSGGPITGSGTITLSGILGIANGGTDLNTTPTNGQLLIGNGTNYTLAGLTAGTGISVTPGAGSISIANTGVTSVALSAPGIFTVSGSPVTTTGTLSFSLNTQTQNLVFASPNGSTGAPTFRAMVQADLSFLQLYKENASSPTAPTAAGTNAIALGSGATASGTGAFAVGDGTSASIWGGKAFANGKFATAGDAQAGTYVLRSITTNATFTEGFLDGAGATQRLVVPNNSVWTFDILVAARRTDATGGGASYRFTGGIRKDGTAGSTTFIGTPSKVILGETNTAWDARVTADTTNGSLMIEFKGEAAKTVRWVAVVNTAEVTN